MSKFALRFAPMALALTILVAACEPKHAIKPPPDKPDDPTLATAGSVAITKSYLEIAFGNLPVEERDEFRGPDGPRKLLEKQIDTIAYYLEGLRREWKKEAEFREAMGVVEKAVLVYMARERAAAKIPPVGDDDVRAAYQRYVRRTRAAKGEPKSFEDIDATLRAAIERQRFRRAGQERVAELMKDYGAVEHRELLAVSPKDAAENEQLRQVLVESRAFELTLVEFFAWIAGQPPAYQEQAKTNDGRNWLLDRYLEDEFLRIDAISQQLHKSDEYATRMLVAEISILGRMAQERITEKNIRATGDEARAYLAANPDKLAGKTWEKDEEEIRRAASEAKRARIIKEFADALRRDRYLVAYREDAIAKIDLASITDAGIEAIMPERPGEIAEEIDYSDLIEDAPAGM